MRILHLADLHLGKSLHGLSLVESMDQSFWIDQILSFVHESRPDAVVIAGDVYDRGIPAKEAIPLLSRLLTGISRQDIPVYLIAGNHDGAERLEFLAETLRDSRIYIAGTVQKEMLHVTQDIGDGCGPVTFWLMPYIFPAAVRTALSLPESEIPSYTAAAKALLDVQEIDFSQRNVLIAHQTVLYMGNEPTHSESETAIGGVGGIDAEVFSGFDYVALGHIHGAQAIGGHANMRYAGSPLCYHFGEANQTKGPLLVELGAKGTTPICTLASLKPLHRVRPAMVGKLAEIIEQEKRSSARGEYIRVVLTDDKFEIAARETLRALFESHDCRLLDLSREPERKAISRDSVEENHRVDTLSLEDLFFEYYRQVDETEHFDESDARLIQHLADLVLNRESDAKDAPVRIGKQLVDYVKKQEARRE